jgi:Zn-dependent protease/predicted transcriptional regulator
MQGSIRLGRIAGIEVAVHYSWLFAFLLVSWSLAAGFFPARYHGWTSTTYWLVGVVSALSLFGSVLVHELSHSLVARARGRGVRGITLFVFGGVSRLEGEDKTPTGEFVVSVVGPLTSFALAAVFWAVERLLPAGESPLHALLVYLALVNALLGAFNLLPGFPLDGGRVLRSAIWGATGSFRRATEIASYVGQGVGLVLMVFGVAQVFAGNVLGGLWIAFIGWFLNVAAEGTRQEYTLREEVRGIRVADVMTREFPTASPDLTVDELFREHVLRRGRRALVVVDAGRLLGIVTVTDARKVPQSAWATTSVVQIMTQAPLQTLAPDAPLAAALGLLVDGAFNQVPVVEGTRAIGLLTRADVVRLLQLRMALGVRLPERRTNAG